tara:strand:- start:2001 stop:2333 length:333 start_codon:yes stop_codon:yes gene_type:complete
MKRYSPIKEIKTKSNIIDRTIEIPQGKTIYKTVKYPEIPRIFNDIYIYTTIGDRYDTLANTYYKDTSLWWIISLANATLPQNSLIPPPGTQLRIPSNPSPIISSYIKLNS